MMAGKKKGRVQLTIEIEARPFAGEDTPAPDIELILESWMAYCGGELLSYKELAEGGAVDDIAVTATVLTYREA
jgi:hypothetical protein